MDVIDLFKVGDYAKVNPWHDDFLDAYRYLAIVGRKNGKSIMSLKEMYNYFYGTKMFETDVKNDEAAVEEVINSMYLPKIKKVIFNGPATIVMWDDGDKTVVHCGEGEVMDKEKGLAMAICKKALGKSKTHYDYYNVFKKWIKEDK